MLSYTFFHSPAPTADLRLYEQRLITFHKSLSTHPPTGFRSSYIFRTEGAPWIANASPAYEDWYLVEYFAALGAINDAAVSGPRKQPHDQIASLAAAGSAGLYLLKSGPLDSMTQARHSTWLCKPAISYDEFYDSLRPITNQPTTTLWQRQMVLSVAPEFCLRTLEKPTLPPAFPRIDCPVQGIHPS
jgi:hypothetical protein